MQSDSWEEPTRIHQSWFQQHSIWDIARKRVLRPWMWAGVARTHGYMPEEHCPMPRGVMESRSACEDPWPFETFQGEPSIIPNFPSPIPPMSAKGPCWQKQPEARR